MTVVDFYASAPHFFSHIAPIYEALPEPLRGTFYITTSLHSLARERRIPARQSAVSHRGPPIVAASYGDYRTSRLRDVIFVEHGAGQTYEVGMKGSPGYAGGTGRERSILFICPSERVAALNRERYPHIPTAVVGSPRLDRLHTSTITRPTPPIVAITFHADYNVTPETKTGYAFFHRSIPLLRNAGYSVLGHGHPRIYRRLMRLYDGYGIPHTADPDEVLQTASVLCVDNSSIMYEAASLGIAIVAMNPPFYRRDVHHGLRFWSHIPGPQADSPQEVVAKVKEALQDGDSWAERRREISEYVYAFRDGTAAARAAAAIISVVDNRASSEGIA